MYTESDTVKYENYVAYKLNMEKDFRKFIYSVSIRISPNSIIWTFLEYKQFWLSILESLLFRPIISRNRTKIFRSKIIVYLIKKNKPTSSIIEMHICDRGSYIKVNWYKIYAGNLDT